MSAGELMAVELGHLSRGQRSRQNGVNLDFQLCKGFQVAGLAPGLQDRQGLFHQAIEPRIARDGHSAGERRKARHQYASDHRADVDQVAVFVEKALLLAVEEGGGAGMGRENLAFVGAGRFDVVGDRSRRGGGGAVGEDQPGHLSDYRTVEVVVSHEANGRADRFDVFRGPGGRAAEGAAQDFVLLQAGKLFGDGFRFANRERKRERRRRRHRWKRR